MDIRELLLRKTIPVVINSFNQLTYLQNIINKFRVNKFKNIIILDNDSDYPPLLEYYTELMGDNDVIVIYYNNNNGPRHFHQSGLYKLISPTPHLYTDPDLDFDLLSNNYLSTLIDISEKYGIFKVGSALELPCESELKPGLYMTMGDTGIKVPLIEWESTFWVNEFEPLIYNSPIDTTLHLFNPVYFDNSTPYLIGARVAKEGFAVKHLPWYKHSFVPQEEVDYYKVRGFQYNNY